MDTLSGKFSRASFQTFVKSQAMLARFSELGYDDVGYTRVVENVDVRDGAITDGPERTEFWQTLASVMAKAISAFVAVRIVGVLLMDVGVFASNANANMRPPDSGPLLPV